MGFPFLAWKDKQLFISSVADSPVLYEFTVKVIAMSYFS